jgi:hypothetical protein
LGECEPRSLGIAEKIIFAGLAFPDVELRSSTKDRPTLFHIVTDLCNNGVRNLHIVGGSDQKGLFQSLQKYNNQKSSHGYYSFQTMQFHCVGDDR